MNNVFPLNINGQQVCLRDFQLKDLDFYRKWRLPGHKWQDFDAPYFNNPTEKEINGSIENLKQSIQHQNFPNPRNRLIISLKETDKMIGTVSSYWKSKKTNWLCIGIVIYDEKQWGKNLGFDALTLWITYLLKSHPEIIRLDLRTWSGNEGMIKLAKKLGFQEEARFRKARIVNEKYYDGLGFGILREEWL